MWNVPQELFGFLYKLRVNGSINYIIVSLILQQSIFQSTYTNSIFY